MKTDSSAFALAIDDAIGSEQTLVKPLPDFLKNCLCFSSVTVLGNGNAVAMLSAEGIVRLLGIEGIPLSILSEDNAEPDIIPLNFEHNIA